MRHAAAVRTLGLAIELLNTDDEHLEINAAKVKSKFKYSLEMCSRTGKIGLHLYLAMLMLGMFMYADTEMVEGLPGAVVLGTCK